MPSVPLVKRNRLIRARLNEEEADHIATVAARMKINRSAALRSIIRSDMLSERGAGPPARGKDGEPT